MSKRLRRIVPLSLALLATAGIVGIAGADALSGHVVIIAPTSVVAGFPICGYATSPWPPMTIFGSNQAGDPLPGSPVSGPFDPTFFIYPTTEPMSGEIVTLLAFDSQPTSDIATVYVQ